MLPMDIRNSLSYAGSVTAVAGSAAYALFAQGDTATLPAGSANAAMTNASSAAMLIAIGGLASAVGPQLFASVKLYLENQRLERKERWERQAAEDAAKWERQEAEQKAKWERHNIVGKLDAAQYEIARLRGIVDKNRELIGKLADRHDAPSPDHPDPLGEFKEALKQANVDSGEFKPVKLPDEYEKSPDEPTGNPADPSKPDGGPTR